MRYSALSNLGINICRLGVAVTFILSGFVKAVDPIGSQIKIEDYLSAWHVSQYIPDILTLLASVVLSATEFTLGMLLLFAIRRRLVTRLVMTFMAVMTPLTLWIAISNPVSDCGCFGDAIVLGNWETFFKNVVLTAATAVLLPNAMKMPRLVSLGTQWLVINYTMLFILALAGYSLYILPPLDFRPYYVGADIRKGMEIPEGAEQPKFETTFILEKDGERREFTLDNYPDSTWTFIDSRTIEVSKGYVPPIHDFSITRCDNGEDITDEVIDNRGYTMLLIAPYLEKSDDMQFNDINRIYDYAIENKVAFYCLTASGEKMIERWKEMTGAEYPFCHTDATTLRTIIRSSPGLVVIRNGRIIGKWSHNAFPDESMTKHPISRSEIGHMPDNPTAGRIAWIVSWFVVPLFLLTLADRLWAWTSWLRRKEESSIIYKLLKKKRKMRKKIVAGNWKMNMNLQDGIALAKELNETLTAEKPNCGVVICTPFIHLASIAQFLNQDIIGLGAENCADKEKGAYTGEVSAEMVKSTGAQYVILGHSERREYYKETPEILKEKVLLALKNGLKVIFCIGESLAEREANKQNEVCKAELEGSVFNLTAEEFKNIVIAYEPIWAIGTGKTATADQAEEIHAFIRSCVAEKYGEAVADETSILYGGSCKASNAPELFAKPDIDGGLIGGASLKAADFKGIIDAWKK